MTLVTAVYIIMVYNMYLPLFFVGQSNILTVVAEYLRHVHRTIQIQTVIYYRRSRVYVVMQLSIIRRVLYINLI